MLSLIVAISDNQVIGKSGAPMLWHLPADLRHFKDVTLGHPIIMGRKTHESIGRLLPGRQNIIVTRQKNYEVPGATVARSLQEAISAAEGNVEAFIIGGGQIFEQALEFVQRLYVTEVHGEFDGDITFTVPDGWREISRDSHQPDDTNQWSYDFVTYEHQP